MGRWFGTDGVRGAANRELTPELALRLGRLTAAATEAAAGPVLIGRDPRRSGDMLAATLAAGLASGGRDTILLGVVPTAAVAWLVRRGVASAGAMISASHNPAPDNGIKLFGADGYKLPDAVEERIEAWLEGAEDPAGRPEGTGIGRILPGEGRVDAYLDHLRSIPSGRLEGMRIVVDAANGAASGLVRPLFESLGCRVEALAAMPDGDNINEGCGALHPEVAARRVREAGADLGLCLDGDADRLIAIDEHGSIIDGDHIMAALALDRLERSNLPGRTLVATVMSNLGLERALAAVGGRVVRAPVGDRHVLSKMLEGGYGLGGEQSGHIISLEHNCTGDGLITGLLLLDLMLRSGRRLSEWAARMPEFPQVLRNVRVRDRNLFQQDEGLKRRLASLERSLSRQGRLLVRPSGTEPLVRVLAEGEDAAQVEQLAEQAAALIRERFGVD